MKSLLYLFRRYRLATLLNLFGLEWHWRRSTCS